MMKEKKTLLRVTGNNNKVGATDVTSSGMVDRSGKTDAEGPFKETIANLM